MIEVWFDGCCEPVNPGGHAGYGAAILDGSKTLWECSGYILASPQTSNNLAEYTAFLSAVDWLVENKLHTEEIIFYGDSKLVINQMFGSWRIRKGIYVPLAIMAREKIKKLTKASGEWVPREENYIADELSKRELLKRGIVFKIQPQEH